MATNSKIDELNNLSTVSTSKESGVMSIEDYFDGMELDEDAIEKRKELAYAIYGLLIYAFTLIKAYEVSGDEPDSSYLKDYIAEGLIELYRDTFGDDSFNNRAIAFSSQIIDTTLEHQGTSYFTSSDRAIVCAENESNSVISEAEFKEATNSGYTRKMWLTKRDKRVRHTHTIVDGEELNIKDAFEVGNSKLMFPCDISLGASAKEIVNCRCVCIYK